jgi:hypothetical protein
LKPKHDIQRQAHARNVIFGQFNSRRLELTYNFERGLVFECHISKLLSNFASNLDLRQYMMGQPEVCYLMDGLQALEQQGLTDLARHVIKRILNPRFFLELNCILSNAFWTLVS